jgi:hypothetical protein
MFVLSSGWIRKVGWLLGCENGGAKRLVFSGLRRILNLWSLPGFGSFSGTTQIANRPSFLSRRTLFIYMSVPYLLSKSPGNLRPLLR